MPITPFHFGPGAALHALAPQRVSFLAFCAANLLIDVEPLIYLLRHEYPWHRFLHSYPGAALASLATVGLFLAARAFARRFWLPTCFGWQSLALPAVTLGAVLGGLSHVLLDSFMHPDIAPLAPWLAGNPLLGRVPLELLHWGCVGAGIAGVGLLYFRQKPGPDASEKTS